MLSNNRQYRVSPNSAGLFSFVTTLERFLFFKIGFSGEHPVLKNTSFEKSEAFFPSPALQVPPLPSFV